MKKSIRQWVSIVLSVLSCKLLTAQELICSYPLTESISEEAGLYGDIFCGSDVVLPPTALCSNGVYTSGAARTPSIPDINPDAVFIKLNFEISDYAWFYQPIVVFGSGYRWLGVTVKASTRKLAVVYNNFNFVDIDYEVALNTTMELALIYFEGVLQVYIDDVLVIENCDLPFPLNHGNDKTVLNAHYGYGGVLNGCISNLKIYEALEISCGDGYLLPVELSNFNVGFRNEENLVNISWKTDSELNSDKFLIEHSVDHKNWLIVDSLNAAGNSVIPINYQILTSSFVSGANYYRLVQIDYDGKMKFSDSQTLIVDNQLAVFPNPVGDYGVISNISSESITNILIFDALGRDVTAQLEVLSSEKDGVNIDFSKLSQGYYSITDGKNIVRVLKI